MTIIDLGASISPYLTSSIQSTINFGIADFIVENEASVTPTAAFSTTVNLDRFIDLKANEVTVFLSSVISPYLNEPVEQIGYSIISTAIVPEQNVLFVIGPESILSNITFNGNTLDFKFEFPGIPSSLLFGTSVLTATLEPQSIESTATLSTDSNVLYVIGPDSITSTLSFNGNVLNITFDLPGTTFTSTFGTPDAFISIGPASTVLVNTFGLPSIPRVVHRSLIYKDDNISKLGGDDDVEVASGIVIHSSAQNLPGGADYPVAPAGFVIVTINGVDYKMPFFNL